MVGLTEIHIYDLFKLASVTRKLTHWGLDKMDAVSQTTL